MGAAMTGWERDKLWAQSARVALIVRLGGRCDDCGDIAELEVHHKDGRDYSLRELSQAGRVRRYISEESAGVALGVLCRRCNARDGGGRRR